MVDSYGDGWNGNWWRAVPADPNSATPPVAITLPTGRGPATEEFCLPKGETFLITDYEGTWQREVGWSLERTDEPGVEVMGGGCPYGGMLAVAPASNPDASLVVEILTDNYPSETSWDVTQGGVTLASYAVPSGTAAQTTIVSDPIALSGGVPATFNIYDTYGDGNCCRYGAGSWGLAVDGVALPNAGMMVPNTARNFEYETKYQFATVADAPTPSSARAGGSGGETSTAAEAAAQYPTSTLQAGEPKQSEDAGPAARGGKPDPAPAAAESRGRSG